MSQRIGILGLGRSGLAIALATKARGDQPVVYDSKPVDDKRIAPLAKTLNQEGIEFHAGWDSYFLRGRGDKANEIETLVTSPGVDMRKPMLVEAARSGIEVIGEIEFAYRIARAPIIAITGTNGKSTTTVMTFLALRAAGLNAVLCGNIWGSGYDEIPLTEAAANSTSDQILVAEISSFQLEWVKDFRPRCAGITNISPDHLNRYDSFDQYAATKRKLFDRMAEGDTIVANAGDTQTYPTNQSLRDRGAGLPRVRFYSSAGVDASFDSHSLKLSICEPLDLLPFKEKHNLINACHASLLAESFMDSIDHLDASQRAYSILQGLKGFKGLAHRMEHVGHRNGIDIINNSMCTNPQAIVASSSSIVMPQHLLIGGIKKNYDFKPVSEYLERTGHTAYCFGRDAQEISQELSESVQIFDTMKEAFGAATEKAVPGETIMLAPGCASMDQFDDFVARGEEFKKMAKEWLNNEKQS
ncbi:MAG: UDP-N-acetylmuramoyl-L-alanine--D-glutamate ligase [Fimbriimonadaceae bacterium]